VVERASGGARTLAAALADLARLRSLAEAITKGAEEEPATGLLEFATTLERHGQHAVLVVDEAHIIGGWGEAGDRLLGALREIAHRESRPLTLVLASSETSALQRLRDSPLVWALESPRVPAIEFDEWRPALRDRFSRAGRPVDEDALEAILETFEGHPFKTMWVAREAASLAQREQAGATAGDHVEAAGQAARDQRWAGL
jgi:type II secretory pathway predicted ATPase ExeA